MTKSSRQHSWRRRFLLLLLVPLAYAVYCLAKLPISVWLADYNISADGMFVLTGYLEDKGMNYGVLSLHTGKTIRLHASKAELSPDGVYWHEQSGDRVHLKRLELSSFEITDLGDFDGRSIWEIQGTSFQSSSSTIVQPGFLATHNTRNELCVVDLRTGAITTSTLPSTGTPYSWFPMWCESPHRLWVIEMSNGRTQGQYRRLLFSYEDGKLKQLANWMASDAPIVAHGKILTLTIDHQLEIRRLSDGTLIDSQPLASALNLTVPASAPPVTVWLTMSSPKNEPLSDVETGIVGIAVPPARHIIYDYLRQRVITQQTNLGTRCADMRFGKAVYLTNQTVVIKPLEDKTRLTRFEFPLTVYSARLMAGGEQLLVLLPDESVHVCDIASGRILRSYRPRYWVMPTFVTLVAGFAGWTWLWFKQSMRCGTNPLWDIVLWNGLILAGLLLRAFLQGTLRDPGRPIYQYLQVFGVSWLVLLQLWFVFGHSRWSIKVIAPLGGLTSTLLVAFLVAPSRQSIWQLLIGFLAITLTASAVFGIARSYGWRLLDPASISGPQSVQHAESRMPLRDMFLVLAAVGVFLAVLRFIPFGSIDLSSAWIMALSVGVAVIASISGAWLALSPRHWLLRILVVALSVGVSWLAYCALEHDLFNWTMLRFMVLITAFTCVPLLAYRVRGWRLARFPLTSYRSRHAPS